MKNNSEFRLIAIRPLEGCHQQYLKILTPDQLYYFHNNYEISDDDTITVKDVLPRSFFSLENIDVNITAIVGKNGSGKSTLIELLFRTINNIAFGQREITANLEKVPQLSVELYLQIDNYLKIRIENSNIEVYRYDRRGSIIPRKEDIIRLREFFYTIAINYSHYSYNSIDMNNEVNWLNGLFHKNDGYQTPLVINPKRTNGNIDINNENHLVKSRLIGNLLRPPKKGRSNFRELTDQLEATSLRLTLNRSKRESVLYPNPKSSIESSEGVKLNNLDLKEDELLSKLNREYNFKYKSIDKKKYALALDYLLYKLVSIATKYDNYRHYFSKDENHFHEEKVDEFIEKLIADNSHITFKLRQTLHFLRYQVLELKDQPLV